MSIASAEVNLARLTDTSVEVELVAAHDRFQPQYREQVEQFVRAVFRHAYGARINHFLPYLLSMRQQGKILAALGIRPAREGELFLEVYLDQPIESALASQARRPVARDQLVEVGNLASAHGGGAKALIITLTAYLNGAGFDWAVFTATRQVRNSFVKLGIELIDLAEADKSRLGDAQNAWGSYYEQAPRVVAANVAQATVAVLAAMRQQRLFPDAHQLWCDAHRAGRQGDLWTPPGIMSGTLPQHLFDHTADYIDGSGI